MQMSVENSINYYLLLVEDSPTDAAIMSAAFTRSTYSGQIQLAQNGNEALEILEQATSRADLGLPCLVLLDLNLPGKPGYEVLSEIKAHPRWQNIPVIIFSSSANPSDVRKSYSLSVNAYLTKPGTLQEYELIAQRINDFWLDTAQLAMN